MVSNHGPHQVAGNPKEPSPPCKFPNHWTISIPPGWSCLFVPPLNRPHESFEVLSGVVDTDRFTTPVNFPFIATGGDGVHVLPKGTPLVQVVPFRRADAAIAATVVAGVVRAETDSEAGERRRIHRSIRSAAGWYRNHARFKR